MDVKNLLVINSENLNIPDSSGGIYNSSIFEYDGYYYIIGRCESIPEDYRSGFIFEKHSPILFKIDKYFNIVKYSKLEFVSPVKGPKRIEDFRVFKYNQNIYVNHVVLTTHPHRKTLQTISKLDIDNNRLINLEINLDIQVNDIEKNWLFFQHNSSIKMIYSISPLIILTSEEDFNFRLEKNEINKQIENEFFISGSTNPISINDEYYLSFYHYRDEEKIYHQVPYLISKEDLTFKNISDVPIFSGGDAMGIRKNVLYLMSHIKYGDDLLLSFGEGDSVTTIKKIKINYLLKNEKKMKND